MGVLTWIILGLIARQLAGMATPERRPEKLRAAPDEHAESEPGMPGQRSLRGIGE